MPRLADDRLAIALSRIWRDDTPPPSSDAQTLVEDIERRYEVRLPETFRDYVLHAAPNGEWMDDDYITWWSPDRIKNISEECGSEPPSGHWHSAIEGERDHYLVFADYLVWCHA